MKNSFFWNGYILGMSANIVFFTVNVDHLKMYDKSKVGLVETF